MFRILLILLFIYGTKAYSKEIHVYPLAFNYAKYDLGEEKGDIDLIFAFKDDNLNVINFDEKSTLGSIMAHVGKKPVSAGNVVISKPFEIGGRGRGGRIELRIKNISSSRGMPFKIRGLIFAGVGGKQFKLLNKKISKSSIGKRFWMGEVEFLVQSFGEKAITLSVNKDPSKVPGLLFKNSQGKDIEIMYKSTNSSTIFDKTEYSITYNFHAPVEDIVAWGEFNVSEGENIKIPFLFEFSLPY